MATIIRSEDIRDVLQTGSPEIKVTASDYSLGTSDYSIPVVYSAGGLTFKLSDTGDYYICTGADNYEGTSLTIPSTHKGSGEGAIELPVRELSYAAFMSYDLEEVILPNTLQVIGIDAFRLCKNLKSIFIPKSVKEIKKGAFYRSGVSSMTFEQGSALESIGEEALACSLTTIQLPEGLKTIGARAFMSTQSLTGCIDIPSTVESIGLNAFYNTNITSIDLSRCAITEIAPKMFDLCKNLEEISLGNSITRINSEAFLNCSSLDRITIPESVTWIGSKAFKGCTNLTVQFESTAGWFYTLESSIPETILDGDNCTHITEMTASVLTTHFVLKNIFRLQQVPAPSIEVTGGILTITDTSGLADTFNIYINGELAKTIPAAPTVLAGTWVANNTLKCPEKELRGDMRFTVNGLSAEHNLMWWSYSSLNESWVLCYRLSGGDGGVVYTAVDYSWSNDRDKTITVVEDTVVTQEFYNWFRANFTKQ
jgi:hypothetical protein